MSRQPPPPWPPRSTVSKSVPDTLRDEPPGPGHELDDLDTIAVPLANAEPLPGSAYELDDLDTIAVPLANAETRPSSAYELGDLDTIAVPLANAETRPGSAYELGDLVTIAVPLAGAERRTSTRLAVDDRPTLRTSLSELAALVQLTQPRRASPSARSAPLLSAPQPVPYSSDRPVPSGVRQSADRPLTRLPRQHPADRTQAVRRPDLGQNQPIQRVPHSDATRPLPAVTLPPQRMLGAQPALPQAAVASSARPVVRPSSAGAVELMPTQLWFMSGAPRAAVLPAKPAPPSLWARLWSLFGFAAPQKVRNPARHPRSPRSPVMRR